MDDKIIYRLDDNISFRKCSLYDEDLTSHGDCTNYYTREIKWTEYYSCNQEGIHLHCTKNPEIELDIEIEDDEVILICPKCKNRTNIKSLKDVYSRCQKLLNVELFKDAKLIRLDDWYIPEIKDKIKPDSDYWITTNVKTDKDGSTIVVLYIGHNGSGNKVQFFIKPEKGQLSSDHKDLDPAKILSKIEVTLKNRTLTQEYKVE
jgi:hypothetical protein